MNSLANVRDDNQQFLDVVPERYKVIQDREAFAFMDKLTVDGELLANWRSRLTGWSVVITAQFPTVDTHANADKRLTVLRFMYA